MNRLFELEKELAQYSRKGQQHTLNSPANTVSTAQSLRGGFSKAMGNVNKICILSIDGGGIRGLIPALILEEIEKRLRKRTTKEKAFVQDFFDFFAGTSTGGILTAGLLVPRREGVLQNNAILDNVRPPRPDGYEYSISELAQLYSGDIRHHIFCGNNEETFGPAHRREGVILGGQKYLRGIDAVLSEKFGSVLFTELKKPLLITSVSLEFGLPKIFCNVNEIAFKDIFKAVDVVRATSAAPTFFNPADVTYTSNGKTITEEFVDGGLYQNNPSFLAFNHVRKNFNQYNNVYKRNVSIKTPELIESAYQLDSKGKEMYEKLVSVSEIAIISLGTGGSFNHIPINSMDGGGSAYWAKSVVNLCMSSNSHAAHLQTYSNSVKDYYIRINPSLPVGGIEMDDVSDGNINKMKKTVADYIASKEGSDLIDKAVELLANSNYW